MNYKTILIFLMSMNIFGQNIVIKNGDATEAFDSVPSDHTIMYGCEGEIKYFHYDGDYTLPGDMLIGRAVVTIYGDLDYNGFEVIYLCDSSELILSDEPLNTPEADAGELRVYPNPTTGIFYVTTNRGWSVNIYNLSGQLVARTPDLRGLPSGLYLAVVTVDERKKTF